MYQNIVKRVLAVTIPILLIALGLLLASCSSDSVSSSNSLLDSPPHGSMGDGNLNAELEEVLSKYDIPAATAMFMHEGEVLETGAVGKRDIGLTKIVTERDKWHIGSITKSFTSTLAAVLVENGLIHWDSTIIEVFPELHGQIRQDFELVTLEELLSHTSGITTQSSDMAQSVTNSYELITTQRLEFSKLALNVAPATTRGNYAYSNAGYIIAGAMLEKTAESDWESLMQKHIFTPLQMTDSGFGPAGSSSNNDQPVGHVPDDGQWFPIPSDSELADNPPVFGPAGTIHTTLSDMSSYLSLHLYGANGKRPTAIVSPDSFSRLHAPASDSGYSLGWNVSNSALSHIGSNERWIAQIIVVPDLEIALFIAINAADPFTADGGAPLQALIEIGQRIKTRFDNAHSESL